MSPAAAAAAAGTAALATACLVSPATAAAAAGGVLRIPTGARRACVSGRRWNKRGLVNRVGSLARGSRGKNPAGFLARGCRDSGGGGGSRGKNRAGFLARGRRDRGVGAEATWTVFCCDR